MRATPQSMRAARGVSSLVFRRTITRSSLRSSSTNAVAAVTSSSPSDSPTTLQTAMSAATNLVEPALPSLFKDAKPHLIDSTLGSKPSFVRGFSGDELASFIMVSMATSSSGMVRLSTKLMPFTPNFLIKHLVFPIYCGGETFEEVVKTGRKLLNRGYNNMMLSYSVEDAEGNSTSKQELFAQAVPEICRSIDGILVKHYDQAKELYESGQSATMPASGYIALKPTGLMEGAADILRNYNKPGYEAKWESYLNICRQICQYAVDKGEGKAVIVFDAEKRLLQDGVYAAQRAMMQEFNRDGNVYVIGTVQMYLQDSLERVKADFEHAGSNGYLLGLKLVRGAYLHSELDRYNVIHRTKAESDTSYNTGVAFLLDDIISGWKNPTHSRTVGRLIVASHNEESAAIAHERMLAEAPLGFDANSDESVIFGQLMGMADDQGKALTEKGRKVIKYVPWGPLGETKEYLVRRLEENGDSARQGGLAYVRYGLGEAFGRFFGRQKE
jgi:proline dehydrogenase